MLCLVELEVDIDDSEITTLQQFSGKSATNGLHFFVRYDNMYCSDAQMSLLKKQMERGADDGWKSQHLIML